MTEDNDWVQTEIVNQVGILSLNRPNALNALTTNMVNSLSDSLARWSVDPRVSLILLRGAGTRGLSAGGDLRSMRESAQTTGADAREFFRAEYRLNNQISHYPKPYVSLMEGITMGGGIGLAAHGSTRIVTESSVLAMPEVAIGLVPDVGTTWLLSRSPGELGTYAALTGTHFGPADALALGLADFVVPSDQLSLLVEKILESGSAIDVSDFATQLDQESHLIRNQFWIDELFSGDNMDVIAERLRQSSVPEARAAERIIQTRSPQAVKVTLAAIRRSGTLNSLEEALEQEFRVSCSCVEHPDLIEGIRSVIIDKDGQPAWQSPTLRDVTVSSVESFFQDRGYGNLDLLTS